MTNLQKSKKPARYAFAMLSMMVAPNAMAQSKPVIVDPVTNCTLDDSFIVGYFSGLDQTYELYGYPSPDKDLTASMPFNNKASFDCGVRSATACMQSALKLLNVVRNPSYHMVSSTLDRRQAHCLSDLEKGPMFKRYLGM